MPGTQNEDGCSTFLTDKTETTQYKDNNIARGERISRTMAMRGYRYNCEISYDIGVTESTISRWRMGRPIAMKHAVALCACLNMSLDYLFLGVEPGNCSVGARSSSEFIVNYHALSEDNKALVLGILERLSPSVSRAHGLRDEIQNSRRKAARA